jgi:hypothetical protein
MDIQILDPDGKLRHSDQATRRECAAAQYVNLALDGWSDPRRRRSEGVTVRLIRADLTTSVHLLAFNKLVNIHDTSHKLGPLIGWVLDRSHIKDKLLNRCTDRAANNLILFTHQSEQGSYFGLNRTTAHSVFGPRGSTVQ